MRPLRFTLAAAAAAVFLVPIAARADFNKLPLTSSVQHLPKLTVEAQKGLQIAGPVRYSVKARVNAIDALVEKDLFDSGMPGASLAILKGGRLVYAQGYTRAAAPQATIPSGDVTPLTYFRQASVSKTFAAVAFYRFLQEKHPALQAHGLDTKVADILGSGLGASAAFKAITVRELLAHSSGIDATVVWQDVDVVKAAGHSLPMTTTDLAHFTAKAKLTGTPGISYGYNNAGYFMLSLVVTQLAGQPWTPAGFLNALKSKVLTPLHMSHVRMADSLFSQQEPGEARYQDFKQKATSVMTKAQPQVDLGYGESNLAAALGAGGLSASAVDVGRLVASIQLMGSSPVLSAATHQQMLDNAVATKKDPNNHGTDAGRSGHGFDDVTSPSAGHYAGQKGGYLSTSQNMIYFETGNDGISYVINWSGHTTKADGGWYPKWNALLDLARAHDWGNTDLFPAYGMPAFNKPLVLGPVRAQINGVPKVAPGALKH